MLSPTGCFIAALNDYHLYLDNNDYDNIWENFRELMTTFGYAEEGE